MSYIDDNGFTTRIRDYVSAVDISFFSYIFWWYLLIQPNCANIQQHKTDRNAAQPPATRICNSYYERTAYGHMDVGGQIHPNRSSRRVFVWLNFHLFALPNGYQRRA